MARDYWFSFGAKPSDNSGLAPTFIYFINSAGATQAPPSVSEPLAGSGLYKTNYTATQTISFVLDGATTGLATANRYIFGVLDPYDTTGQTLIAVGNTAIALGTTAVAIGLSNIALGTTAVALGVTGVGFGGTAVALGLSNIALGNTNVAIGTSNIALGMTNVAIGLSNIALGNTNVGIGLSNIALGTTSVAIGLSNISLGTTNVAIGTSLTGAVSGIGSSFSWISTEIGTTASTFGDSSTNPDTVFGYLRRVVEFLEGNQTYTKSSGALAFYSRGSSYTLASKTVSDTTTQTTKT